MEPPHREAAFELARSAGWEEEYRAYRENWSRYPIEKVVPDYPLLVDLELSTLCNLRCPMCYTITDEYKKKVNATLMDFELFERLVTEIAGKVPALRLSLRGEPTIHPRFVDCIALAKRKGVKEISTLTNGSTLTVEFFAKIAEAGIDWITVSIDGLGRQYESIRRPLKFDAILENIKAIHAYKQQHSLVKPVVKIQSIWPAIKENPAAFYDAFSPYVDLIAFNPLIDYLGKDSDIVYEDDFYCPQHYQRLVIGADGRAMMCSNDEEATVIVGDAKLQTVHEIWHGDALHQQREIQATGQCLSVPVCRRCYLPRKTEDGESVTVNGHMFIVRNYVNRGQDIGR